MTDINTVLSYTEYNVVTATTDFPIGFDFKEGVDAVGVLINDVDALEAGYALLLKNPTTMEIQPAVLSGTVRIFRETNLDSNLHEFSAGAIFNAQSMDENFEQIRYSQQEIRDKFIKLRSDTFITLTEFQEENFQELKQYVDGVFGMTNPNLFDGISDNMVITENGDSQRVLNRELIASANANATNLTAEVARATAAEVVLQQNINSEVSRASSAEATLQAQINANATGNLAYATYADMDADKANIPAKSLVRVTEDPDLAKRGDWRYDGTDFTKSLYDPLTQANQYTDSEISTVSAGINEASLDAQAAVFGKYDNLNKDMVGGYIAKTDGALVANAQWYSTPYIGVRTTSTVTRQGLLIGASSSATAMALYDADRNFLGAYTDTSNTFTVSIASINPAARYVRFSIQSSVISTATINVYETNYFITDFFTSPDVVKGYVNLQGVLVSSSTWRTTPLVPVKVGMEFTYSGYGNSAVTSNVSEYDVNGVFIRSVYSATGVTSYTYKPTDSGVAYVKASAATNNPMLFRGFQLPKSTTKKYPVYAPSEVYALQGETIYLQADGILGEDLDVAWNLQYGNKYALPITPTTNADIPVQLSVKNDLGERVILADFPVKVTGTPQSPTSERVFLALGDSLTAGISWSSIQGAWVNECSRRLTGIGRQILDNDVSPTPLNLSNIKFIGTLGDNVVKHEGRGGWRATHYLNNSSIGSTTNAFWNPSTSQFDMNYYLTTNNFTDIAADGSNFTVIILLGWNDVYNSNAATAANDLGLLIDKIKSTHPQTHFMILGLNQAPEVNYKEFTGNRYVSRREVFDSIVAFGSTYKAMVASRSNTQFVQISPTFNSRLGYPLEDFQTSARSTSTVSGCMDHVHPNAVGYAHIADTVFYAILYRYCR